MLRLRLQLCWFDTRVALCYHAHPGFTRFMRDHPLISRFIAEHPKASRFVFRVAHHIPVVEHYVPIAAHMTPVFVQRAKPRRPIPRF